MSAVRLVVALWAMAGSYAWAQSAAAPRQPSSSTGGAPFARGEVLNYAVNWPSGLSLGDAQFKVGGGEPGWDFEFTLDASLPGFEIKDRYHSTADAQFCSTHLEKEATHGARKAKETVSYNQQKRQGERQTASGGKTEFAIPDCVKDGLSFVYFLRRELANGRVPPAQAVNFGASYQVTITYGDARQMEIGGVVQPVDRVTVALRGPSSSHTFELFFTRDPARTPVAVRVPFAMGTFALELVR